MLSLSPVRVLMSVSVEVGRLVRRLQVDLQKLAVPFSSSSSPGLLFAAALLLHSLLSRASRVFACADTHAQYLGRTVVLFCVGEREQLLSRETRPLQEVTVFYKR